MKKILDFLIQEIKIIKIYFVLKKKIESFKNFKNKPIILFEFNNYPASQIGGYYFISKILKKKNFEIKSFYNGYGVKTHFKKNFLDILKWKFKKILSLGFIKIYKAYGVNDLIIPSTEYCESDSTIRLYKKIKREIKCKKDVLKIKIKNVLIGDLIYDTYLTRYTRPTVNITNQEFHSVIKECIGLTLYWHNYFQNNKVHYIIGTHGVYSYAIPFRVALKFKVKGFLVNLHGAKEVKKDLIFEHTPKRIKRNLLNNLSKKERIKNIKKAKQELKKIISGIPITNRASSLNISSFNDNKYKKTNLIKPSNKIKILISPHDFFDAAHGYGDHKLFEDYYEWLKYTFQISLKTNYDWYLKTHPDLWGKFGWKQRATRNIINEMCKKYKNIKLLPPNYSHKKIIREGIDFVITCHGTVAYEYSFQNIPVIIASRCNPYREFNFAIQPKDKKEYKKKIMNLGKIKKTFRINKDHIYEWYALKFHVAFTLNWIFNYKDYSKFMDGWYNWQDVKIFKYWMLKKKDSLDKKIYLSLENYLKSKSNMLLSFHEK